MQAESICIRFIPNSNCLEDKTTEDEDQMQTEKNTEKKEFGQ